MGGQTASIAGAGVSGRFGVRRRCGGRVALVGLPELNLAAFGAEARAETDLEALQAHLLRVTDETMRPAQVSVWFRPGKK